MPAWLKNLSLALPFNLIVYAPAQLFVQFEWGRWLGVVAQQLTWIGIAGVTLYLIFLWGIRRVSINGG